MKLILSSIFFCSLIISCSSFVENRTENKKNYFSFYSNLNELEIDSKVPYYNYQKLNPYSVGTNVMVINLSSYVDSINGSEENQSTSILMVETGRLNENDKSDLNTPYCNFKSFKNLLRIDMYLQNFETISDLTRKIHLHEPLQMLKIDKADESLKWPNDWNFSFQNLTINANKIEYGDNILLPKTLESLELILEEFETDLKFQTPYKLKHLSIQMPLRNFEKVVESIKINFETLNVDTVYLPMEINNFPDLHSSMIKSVRTYYIKSNILNLDFLPENIESFHTFYLKDLIGNPKRLQNLKDFSFAFEDEINQDFIDVLSQLNLESLGIYTENYSTSLAEFLKSSNIPSIEIFGLMKDVDKEYSLYKRKGIIYHLPGKSYSN